MRPQQRLHVVVWCRPGKTHSVEISDASLSEKVSNMQQTSGRCWNALGRIQAVWVFWVSHLVGGGAIGGWFGPTRLVLTATAL